MDQNGFNFLNDNTGADPGKKKRILVAIGGLLALVLVIVVILMIALGGKVDSKQLLLPVAGTQADLIEITSAGNKDLRDSALLNQSTSTGLVIATHNNVTNGFIGKDASKAAQAYQKTDYNKEFEEAASNGTFDSTFNTILSQRLDLYKQQLVTAYSQLEDANIKQQIAKFHDEAKLLSGEDAQAN